MTPFKSSGLNQIYSKGIEVAFADRVEGRKFIQLHPFAYCKDYLQDAVFSTVNKESIHIYGFSFVPGINKPVNMKETIVALTDASKDAKTLLREAKARGMFMREIDEIVGTKKKTVIKQVTNLDNKVFIFISDKVWLHSPPLLSLYLLLLRVGRLYEGGDVIDYVKNFKKEDDENSKNMTNNDVGYIEAIFEAYGGKLLKTVLERNVKLFNPKIEKNYLKGTFGYSFHDSTGIVSFARSFDSDDFYIKGCATKKTIEKIVTRRT